MPGYPGRFYTPRSTTASCSSNELASGRLTLHERTVSLADVRQDVLIVAGRDDAIAPRPSVEQALDVLTGARSLRFEVAPGSHLGRAGRRPGAGVDLALRAGVPRRRRGRHPFAPERMSPSSRRSALGHGTGYQGYSAVIAPTCAVHPRWRSALALSPWRNPMARLAQTAGLTDIQTEILSAVKTFVDKEIIPYATELEHKDEFPEAIVEGMKEMGLFGLMISEEYGGLGESLLTYALVVEQIARGWMSVSGVINTHFIVAYMIAQHGTDEQKQRLPAEDGDRRDPRRVLDVRARPRLRRRGDQDPRGAGRRRVRHQRPEDVADQRRRARASSRRWSRTTAAATRSTRT